MLSDLGCGLVSLISALPKRMLGRMWCFSKHQGTGVFGSVWVVSTVMPLPTWPLPTCRHSEEEEGRGLQSSQALGSSRDPGLHSALPTRGTPCFATPSI